MAGQNRENVAIFNPLVLPLPSWHPDGPDGAIDGYVIPFVMPPAPGRSDPNRGAQLRVYPTDFGWRAALRNCYDHAETAEQARAFAAAWIRAAEVLENVAKAEELRDAPQRQLLGDGQVVDCEVVDDDEDQDVEACAHCGNVGAHHQQCPTRLGEDQDQDDPPRRVDCPECEGNGVNCVAHRGADVDRDPWAGAVRPFAVGERVRVTDRMSEHHDRIGAVVSVDGAGLVGVDLEANRGRHSALAVFVPAELRPAR